jgi:glucose dehydrogenase
MEVRAQPDAKSQGVACCDLVNRGVAYADGKRLHEHARRQTIAVDAASGKEIWRTKLGDITKGETVTMAPLVVKDKVLVGNSGGELGVRGWLTRSTRAPARIAWRAYAPGPDSEVLIGPDFKPFYAPTAARTWASPPGRPRPGRSAAATSWGWISYDPQADLIYYGTANPGPWNPEQRPGDNKWTAGIFARRPDDRRGALVLPVRAARPARLRRRQRERPARPGLQGQPAQGAGASGPQRLRVCDGPRDRRGAVGHTLRESRPRRRRPGNRRLKATRRWKRRMGEMIRDICPASPGGKDWQPSAWSPRTRLLYIPHQNLCQDMTTFQASPTSPARPMWAPKW